MNTVFVRNYPEPEFNINEVLRYSGSDIQSDTIAQYAHRCFEEVKDKLIYKVCFCETDVKTNGSIIDFGFFKAESKNLSYTLKDSRKAFIFCATIGLSFDREIAKAVKSDVTKGFVLQAIGAERCESLCDAFICDIKEQYRDKSIYLTPRFSPGYGDLDISFQKEIFSLLDLPRKIGVTLNESLVISPSKSVTAIVGLSDNDCGYHNAGCNSCNMKDCTFRK